MQLTPLSMRTSSITLFAGSLVILLSACQKEQNSTPFITQDEVGQPKGIFGRAWNPDETGGGNHRCPWPGSRCSKITMLAEGDGGGIGDVFDAIETRDQATIVAAFRHNQTVLLKYIEQKHYDLVVNNEVVPSALWDLQRENRFMIFGAGENAEVYEIPAS